MQPVSIEKRESVSIVTVSNPPVNALSQTVRGGLLDRVNEANSDSGCSAIVIICSGRTFIAGADIREFGKPLLEPQLPDLVARIEALDKPVVAAMHGTALGGGLELALGCHYRVATEDSVVGFPEVLLGLLPGATGTQRLPRLTGAEFALDMMLSGKQVAAPDALAAGIIDAIVDELLADAVAFANGIVDREHPRISEMGVAAVDPGLFDEYRRKIARKTRGLLSPGKIIDAVELSTQTSFEEATAREREFFLECKSSPQSAGLRHIFFAERGVAKVPGIDKSTSKRPISHIAVVGAGTMGVGIAYACLASGYVVHLLDNNIESLERGASGIRKLFSDGVARGKLTDQQMSDGLRRFAFGDSYDDIADADLVVEAVFENMAIKQEVFARLDTVCKAGAILASNTSTLDVDAIAAATSRPQDVIGLHFFSPAHVMRLLEIVRAASTADDVIATSLQFAKRIGKIGVVVGNDFGFVGNRMLYSYGRENQLLLLEGAAPEFIDKVLYDWGMAMGPNAVGDLAGLDVGYKVRQERADLADDPRFYRVADMLAEQGRYGCKTGRGMYIYDEGSRSPSPDPEVQEMIRREAKRLGIVQRDIEAQEIIERCIYGLVTEGARILADGIASRSADIDVIWANGYGFPRHRGGPMHYADSVGLQKVFDTVCSFREQYGAMYWEPPEMLTSLARDGGSFGDSD